MGRVTISLSDIRTEKSLRDQMESLGRGTRQQFESAWQLIRAGEAFTFKHGLGEIPWAVSVLESETVDGKNPSAALSASVAVGVATATSISVTNGHTASHFYQVRAL